jgi:hypothetical protein
MRHKIYDVNLCYIRDIEWKIVSDVRRVRPNRFHLNGYRDLNLIIGSDSRVARVGPTTPTRATARARKEPTGSLPSWLMSDSQ